MKYQPNHSERLAAQFESFCKRRKATPPGTLYKYRTADAAILTLESGKARWSSPLIANDPFDAAWDVFWPIHSPQYARDEEVAIRGLFDPQFDLTRLKDPRLRINVARLRFELLTAPANERGARVSEIVTHLRTDVKELEKSARVRLEELRRKTRIFCLSETPLNGLMWSHYSDSYRGVVVGFDSDQLERAWQAGFERIQYVTELPALIDADKWLKSVVYGHSVPQWSRDRAWALFKTPDWAYELEWRIVAIAGAGTNSLYEDYRLPSHCIREIVLGSRTPADVQQRILTLARLNSPECGVFRVRESLAANRPTLQLERVA